MTIWSFYEEYPLYILYSIYGGVLIFFIVLLVYGAKTLIHTIRANRNLQSKVPGIAISFLTIPVGVVGAWGAGGALMFTYAQIAKNFMEDHGVYRYRMKKVADMTSREVMRCCKECNYCL